MRAISTRSQDRIADVGTVTSEVLGAMKIVQAFNQQGRETARFADAVERVFATAKRRILLRAIMTAIVIFLMFGAITMVIWQGAIDVAAGRMTGGTIAAFVLYGGLLAGAFGALVRSLWRPAARRRRVGAARANCSTPSPTSARRPSPATLPEPAARRARRSSTSPSTIRRGRETSALNDFSLTVRPRERLAVVGPSGAGKTTIFQLAERFYDPQAGRVLLDGVDLRDADPADVRQRIAMVPQETVIFAAIGARQSALRQLGRERGRSCGRPRATPMPRSSCARFPKGSTPSWAKAARACRAASASASPSPARCCAMRLCCCSTKRPPRSTRKASGWCRTRSTG